MRNPGGPGEKITRNYRIPNIMAVFVLDSIRELLHEG
jgi:hypothetical protein